MIIKYKIEKEQELKLTEIVWNNLRVVSRVEGGK